MRKQVVAIVGRPNVGKSTLFNALAGNKISIVDNTPGVTRDRIYAEVSWLNKDFIIIDTGGIEPDSQDTILKNMRLQAEIAIETADVIVFITDVRQGLVDADSKVADMLRKSGKKVILTVNKVDRFEAQKNDIYEFFNLGMGEPIPISAEGKQGLGDLLDRVTEGFPGEEDFEEETSVPKVAIVGKPNVGKSSIVNKLLGENRVIVSDIAGTTRDSVDTEISYQGNKYIFIDTAGIRKKSKIKEDIERYSLIRTVSAIERSDVVVLVIDAKDGISEQDAKICGIAHDSGKSIVIAVNKWDLPEKDNHSTKKFTDKIRSVLPFASYADIIFISALTGQRLFRLFDEIDKCIASANRRIPTGVLNQLIMEAITLQQPPTDKGRSLKILYTSQVSVKPPTFVFFVNEKKLMHFSYIRYIENRIREAFDFSGTPLRFITRERNEK